MSDEAAEGGQEQAWLAVEQKNLLHAVGRGDMEVVAAIIQDCRKRGGAAAVSDLVAQQDEETGVTPLMQAAERGDVGTVQVLLDAGAPWNQVDSRGLDAGSKAFKAGHQAVADVLVEAGVRAELLFRAMGARQREMGVASEADVSNRQYLDRQVRYEGDDKLLDESSRGVMMEWERPLMKAHAEVICQTMGDVLNVGFGMGIIDGFIQDIGPRSHTIIEAHPAVHARMLADGWDKKEGVTVLFGRWQDVVASLDRQFDGIFFDTFDDDFEAFHAHLPRLLRPGGCYSFFNGIHPENVFFQGVACEVIKRELKGYGLDSQYVPCPVECSDDQTWEGVQFRYFQGGQYFLPVCWWAEPASDTEVTAAEADPAPTAGEAAEAEQ